jgi:beta-mannosidase
MDNGWTCRMAPDSEWITAEVPGNTLADLKYNGIIDSIIGADRIQPVKSLLNHDWEYKVVFDVPLDIIAQDSVYLQFDGIAETADIVINGTTCLRAVNMFRTYIVPCKHLLKEYHNTLTVHFIVSKNRKDTKLSNAISNSSSIPSGRKASYFGGSEINPGMPFMGIWKPVKLIAWSKAIIKEVYFETLSITPNEAVVEATLDIESRKAADYTLTFEINKELQKEEYKLKLKEGKQTVKFKFTMANPDLWWCKGMGKQPLYEATARLMDQTMLISEKSVHFGIRKIEMIDQSDSIGYNFYFKLNGKPVFIKGGVFVPLDMFDYSKCESAYDLLISDASDANMNLLRVWGGGFYESDLFYELCDKYGIMVWQDLPFSCNDLNVKTSQLYSLKEEVSENVGRIRNHPSLVMLFGNSDVSTYADFKSNRLLPKLNPVKTQCSTFFSDDLPHIIHERCRIPFYSACTASENKEKTKNILRDWRVWYDAAPLSVYFENQGGFFLEYGMQSFPDLKTIPLHIDPDKWELIPSGADSFQFCSLPWIGPDINGNRLIKDYLPMYYNDPVNYEAFVYLSQLFQAQTLKSAIEAQRLRKPFCMGSIFWHFNDCWPGITWSVEDYYNRQKPAYFAVKNAFKNCTVIPERLYGDIRVWVVNDSVTIFDGNCIISLMDFDGKVLFTKTIKATIPPDQTQILWLINGENLVKGNNANKTFLHVMLMKNNRIVDENNLFFLEPRYLDLPIPDINYTVEAYRNRYLIKLSSNRFAKNVVLSTESIDVRFSDNNIDLLPGRIYNIMTNFNGTKEELEDNLKIMSLMDSY